MARLRTPHAVQAWLRRMDYNFEHAGSTLRGFREVMRHHSAHCLEGALAAAWILEHQGYPPLLLDLESDDELDHVVFAFKAPSGWGAVGKSKYPALMGRRPVFRSVRDLAWSYVDPFVDETGRVRGYAIADLRASPGPDWRRARGHVWRIERWLYDVAHQPLRASDARHARTLARYRAWKRAHDREPPRTFYADAARMW